MSSFPPVRIVNGYGPTEGTTFTCCYTIPRPLAEGVASIPIGRPIANTRVYVLDERSRPLATGVAGELYIGGDGLAQGYLNAAELTAARFVANPLPNTPDERLYRTGDRVRRLPDGNLEFLGRLDEQVKIRGHRVEPAEIEQALLRHVDVGSCAAMVRALIRATSNSSSTSQLPAAPSRPTPICARFARLAARVYASRGDGQAGNVAFERQRQSRSRGAAGT